MRRTNGKYDKNGKFEAVSWQEAFDEMERQFRRVYEQKGPEGVAIVGSGQYTIPEAYVASKLMKAGFRSNNIDPNARLCMASAVVGFYQTFGVDEPANIYGDIEKCNTMVLWGNNMAEAHPVLWSRVTDRKLTHKETRIVNLTTHTNLSSGMADIEIIFKPNTDLAIANYLAREIVRRRGFAAAEKELEHCRRNGIAAIASTDPEYPPLLREIPDYPHVLYIKGDTAALSARCLSMVGTRNATPYGQTMCNRLVEGLAAQVPGLCIVSGLAFGLSLIHISEPTRPY